MRAGELQAITEEVVGSLEHGLFEEVKFTEFLGPELQLRYSLCGLATAALQRYLSEYHQLRTTRIIIDLPVVSPDGQTRHTFLRHDSHITIDPTYSQFFDYAGFSAIDASLDRSLSRHYPDTKIAVIEDEKRERFVGNYALQAWEAGLVVQGFPSRSVDDLEKIYRRIWEPETCRRFPTKQDAIVDNLVERMADHHE